MVVKTIIFRWLSLILLVVFANVGSGFNFATSILLFILRCLKWLSNKVIADRFMVVEVILFRWLSLISLIVFSNVGPGSNFATLILLFILSGSKFSSKDVVILEIRNCYGRLTDISLITLVASKRHGVFELGITISSSICFSYWCCCSMNSINSSSVCLNWRVS